MKAVHKHPCDECLEPVPCDGELERNHDGWPAVICLTYHKPWGSTMETLCEDCRERRTNESLVSQ